MNDTSGSDIDTLFPSNPSHNMLFQQKNGVVYQYDSSVRSWIKLASDNLIMPLVTPSKDGVMSSDDFKKLNRLVIPPPESSITGTDCVAPYKRGVISLYSGDDFISIENSLNIQNIDQFGDFISQETPFQIHQHTYGFDFKLDVQQLILELEKRGQIKLVGPDGVKGDTGEVGDQGPNGIMAGPPGDSGINGSAPECTLSIEQESFQAQPKPGLKRALVDVRVVPDTVDSRSYSLEFDRQVVGNEKGSASQFKVKQIDSTWVLAITTLTDETEIIDAPDCGIPGERRDQYYSIYYVDVEPILNTIHSKYIDEVDRLKKGYQDIVSFWLQTMSDMFDEQKSALCCALENCISATKSIHAREHMENMAALTLGKAKINLHGRNSRQAVELSSTRLLHEIGGPDLCKGGPNFPKNPSINENISENVPSKTSITSTLVDIDPLINSAVSSARKIELPPGDYVATIKDTTAQVNNLYRGNVKIRYLNSGNYKTIQFLDKGNFSSLVEAQSAYVGLSTSFKHDGGMIDVYLPSLQPRQSSGSIQILIENGTSKSIEIPLVEINNEPQIIESDKNQLLTPDTIRSINEVKSTSQHTTQCQMSISHLGWYEKGWISGRCCGLVMNISGQDYIIIKRSIGIEDNCGGGESLDTPCISKFYNTHGHPSFAWPTFDGRTFAPLPKAEFVTFQYDEYLNELISKKIVKSEYNNGVGNPNGVRHLSYQLMTILFPVVY